MKKASRLLREALQDIGTSFKFIEVRQHIMQAMRKLEHIEKKKSQQNWTNEAKTIKEPQANFIKETQPMDFKTMKQTLDLLDKMIAQEQSKIENKGTDDNIQVFSD